MIELEFFNNQIEIKVESLFNVVSYIVVESRLDMVWFVRLFNLFNPHVKLVQLFLNQVFKVI